MVYLYSTIKMKNGPINLRSYVLLTDCFLWRRQRVFTVRNKLNIYVCMYVYIYIYIIQCNFILSHVFSPVSTTSTVFHNHLHISTALFRRTSRRLMGTFERKARLFWLSGSSGQDIAFTFFIYKLGIFLFLFSHLSILGFHFLWWRCWLWDRMYLFVQTYRTLSE